jgi:thymidylate kinase
VIIEFAGPSCSGKSTLTRRLADEMREHGVDPKRIVAWTTNRRDRLGVVTNVNMLAWCLLNPHVVLRPEGRQLLGAVALTTRLRKQPGVVLLDEGPVKLHKRRAIRKTRADRLLWRALPAPDVLVIVTCDPAVRLERLRREGRTHALALSDEQVLTDVTGDYFARRFARARKVPLVEVDTSSGDVFPALSERLRPLWASHAAWGVRPQSL